MIKFRNKWETAKRLLTVLGFGLGTLSVQAQGGDTAVKTVKYPAGYKGDLNVVYAQKGSWQGKMDFYYANAPSKPTPLVIHIHGGGWNHGKKESQGGFAFWFKAGYAVANVEYRLTPEATAPAAIEDVRCALQYVALHAKEFNIDPNKIVVEGGSAGGHLALMTGLLQKDHRYDGNCPKADNYTIAAIIDQFGITDVWDWAYGPNIKSKSAVNWLGPKSKDTLFAASVSPLSYIKQSSPPVFIVHGDADPVVPYQHSVVLHEKLKALGVFTKFITVPGGKHGGFDNQQKEMVFQNIGAFLKDLKLMD